MLTVKKIKMDSDSDPVVLNFHNSLLCESDLQLLNGPRWLNDTLIGFFFEYLESVVCKEHADQLAFLCPGCTQLLKYSKDSDIGEVIKNLSLDKKNYIFNAVNDGIVTEWNSGTHWSLLIFSRPTTAFYYYDSLSDYNREDAQEVARKLMPHLGLSKPADFLKQECPQQKNCFDCGLHVIANADILVKHLVFKKALNWYSELDSQAKRDELKALILSLK